MTNRWAALLLAALFCATAAACSERKAASVTTSTPAATTDLSGGILPAAARAMDGATSYRLSVTEEDYVLERWGGSDGGTVDVNLKSGEAKANLHRTGDGQYAIVLKTGETYFKRDTCPSWAKIQAGQAVLAPFVITGAELRSSKLFETLPSTSASSQRVKADLTGIGTVTLEVEKATGLPIRITSDTLTNNGKPLEWAFSDWGARVDIPNISSDRLSGPGGNPC